ncbi:MAG: hypothetical protein MUE71_12300 [Chitinophagaceae bacterium]|nr:hypothetical protein [Chitinophagaceae bacterium]MCU0403768.1 hypothetical protein [Chitinophagaceae bacterium]
MKLFKQTRLIIPFLIVIMGVFNLMNKELDSSLRTFWMFLTPFAFFIGVFRAFLLYRQKKSEEPNEVK